MNPPFDWARDGSISLQVIWFILNLKGTKLITERWCRTAGYGDIYCFINDNISDEGARLGSNCRFWAAWFGSWLLCWNLHVNIGNPACYALLNGLSDEPGSFILLYTHLFLLFYYFLYITDPPLHTPPTQPPMWVSVITHMQCISLTLPDRLHLLDGQMIYDSHVLHLYI